MKGWPFSLMRAAIRGARLSYAYIGRVIAASGHDSVSRRAVVSGFRKLFLVLRALTIPRAAERALDDRSAPPLPETAFLVTAAALPGAAAPRLLEGARA